MEGKLQSLIDRVGGISGLSLSVSPPQVRNIEDLEFRISGLDSPYGVFLSPFKTALGIGLTAKWDLFSADLIAKAEQNFRDDPAMVRQLLESHDASVEVTSMANGANLLNLEPADKWVDLTLRWFALAKDDSEDWPVLEQLLNTAMPQLFDLLMGFDSKDGEEVVGEIEGSRMQSSCGKYERSSTNRALCLKHHGVICVACGLDPTKKYGPEGGSIIHVHHLTPLSLMGTPRAISPIDDLVPLCPNCHNFAHKRNPPFSPSEIAALMVDNPMREDGVQ